MENLTERQIYVLKMITRGLENKSISEIMFLSVHTVKVIITDIMKKLGASNRTEAVYIAMKKHIID